MSLAAGQIHHTYDHKFGITRERTVYEPDEVSEDARAKSTCRSCKNVLDHDISLAVLILQSQGTHPALILGLSVRCIAPSFR